MRQRMKTILTAENFFRWLPERRPSSLPGRAFDLTRHELQRRRARDGVKTLSHQEAAAQLARAAPLTRRY